MEVRCLTDIRVVDGDTIRCRAGGRETTVRLYGIDAPELEQLGGPDAADALESIIRGSEPLLMEVIDVDLYGRDVGLLYARRSHRRDSVNIRMVREGYAYTFTRFGGAELGFSAARHDARAARRGVWKDSRAEAPARGTTGAGSERGLCRLRCCCPAHGDERGQNRAGGPDYRPVDWRSSCRKMRLLAKAVSRLRTKR